MPPVKRTIIFADIEAAANAEQGQLGPYVSSYEKVIMPSWSEDDLPDQALKDLAGQIPGGNKLSKSQLAAYYHAVNGTYGPNVTVMGLDPVLIERIEQMRRDPGQRDKLRGINTAPMLQSLSENEPYTDDAGNQRVKTSSDGTAMVEALLQDGALTEDAEVYRKKNELASLKGTSTYYFEGAQSHQLGRKPSSPRDIERILTHSWVDEWRLQSTYEDRDMLGNPRDPRYKAQVKALGDNPSVERAILSGGMTLDEGITKSEQLNRSLRGNRSKDKAMELLGQDRSAEVAQERARIAELESQRAQRATAQRKWWQRLFSRNSSTPAPKKVVETPKKSGKKTPDRDM